ncbi:MAG: flagellar basal body L-ring protein FlgH [Phycisphaerae bacterium]|jgi:flagellar L-ring protein precursor FlgH
MTSSRFNGVISLALLVCSTTLCAQTSSLSAKHRKAEKSGAPAQTPREDPVIKRNKVYEQYSWITIKPKPPKLHKVGDLLTIIVREQRQFKADAELETKREFDAKSELDAFIKHIEGGLGAAAFRRGKPNVDFRFDTELKTEGDAKRTDRLTLRLSGKIIDVKPNGLLVIEAKASVQYDEELSTITLTGTCRKEDVTADNTILSTQIADKTVAVTNEGAVRAASRRGWIPKLLDLLRPI